MTSEYEPEQYWSQRAKDGGDESFLRPVMVAKASDRENASMDRVQKKLMHQMLAKIDLHSKCVLEIGCGVGRWYPFFKKIGAQWHGVDISSNMITLAHRNFPDIDAQVVDSHLLPHADNAFDLVYSVTVIHHNPYTEQEKMVAEMSRVLRPGGICLLFEDIPTGSNQSHNMFPRTVEGWIGLGEQNGLALQFNQLGGYLPVKKAAIKLMTLMGQRAEDVAETIERSSRVKDTISFLDYHLSPNLQFLFRFVTPGTTIVRFQKSES